MVRVSLSDPDLCRPPIRSLSRRAVWAFVVRSRGMWMAVWSGRLGGAWQARCVWLSRTPQSNSIPLSGLFEAVVVKEFCELAVEDCAEHAWPEDERKVLYRALLASLLSTSPMTPIREPWTPGRGMLRLWWPGRVSRLSQYDSMISSRPPDRAGGQVEPVCHGRHPRVSLSSSSLLIRNHLRNPLRGCESFQVSP